MTSRRRSRDERTCLLRRALLAAVAAGFTWTACAAPRPEPVPSPAPLVESDLEPRFDPRIEVVELRERTTGDPAVAAVVGTVVNRADEPTALLIVRVKALNAEDRVVAEATATPETERIPPNGTTRFQAFLRTGPEVVGYHAEALARWPARTVEEPLAPPPLSAD